MFRGLQCLNRAIKKRLFLLYIVKHARVKKHTTCIMLFSGWEVGNVTKV